MKLPQLNVRDFFWITLFIAIVFGWLADRQHLTAMHEEDTKFLHTRIAYLLDFVHKRRPLPEAPDLTRDHRGN